MKNYQQVIIIDADLTKEAIEENINKAKNAVTQNNGEMIFLQDMGIRKLAYEINKKSRGHYFVLYFKAQPTAIFELERLLRINEEVLKFLTIKYETNKELQAFNKMIEKAKSNNSKDNSNNE